MEWATLPLGRYSDLTGRSRRKEFWFFHLLLFVVSLVAGLIDGLLGLGGMILGVSGPLATIVLIGFITPSLTVSVRRLHDTGRSGWWMLIGLIPILGALALLYFFFLDGDAGTNEYGSDPKAGERPSGAV